MLARWQRAEEERSRAIGALVVAALVIVSLAPWWRSYVAGTVDGSTLHFGVEIARGRVPYRDFWLWTPPLHALENALLVELFGPRIVVAHVVGAACRIVLAVALYRWLTSVFPIVSSIVAVVATIAISSTGDTETLFYYTQQAAFYAVLSGAAASTAMKREAAARSALLGWAVAGAFAGAALMTKQTIGGAAILSLVATCATRWREHRRDVLRAMTSLAAGASVVPALIAIWLAKEGALRAAIVALRDGASSKGPTLTMLTRAVTVFGVEMQYEHALALAVAAVVILVVAKWGVRFVGTRAVVGVAVAGAIFVVGYFASTGMPRVPQLACTELGLWGSLVGASVHGVRIVRGDVDPVRRARFHLALTSFAMAYTTSLSWGANELMSLPAFAYVLCEATRTRLASDATSVCAGAAMFVLAIVVKIQTPFNWMGWVEPPTTDPKVTASLEPLRGMKMSPDAKAFYERITKDIDDHSGAGDPILVFPLYQIFYLLADRPPATYAPIHYLDVVPDDVAERDARRVREAPPRVVVIFDVPREVWIASESFFRGGKRSGTMELLDTIESLAPRYELVDTLRVPLSGEEVRVLALR